MADFVKVAKADEFNPGEDRGKGQTDCSVHINGDFFAIDNMCTHEEASLAEGEISGHKVTCPLHGAKFDVRTAVRVAAAGPASHRLKMLAAETGMTQAQLVAKGLNVVFSTYGKSIIAAEQ